MPRVLFQPSGVAADVPAGVLIREAAILAGIDNLELPCGGEGSCSQCLVELTDGAGESKPVLACQTSVQADLVVRVPESRDTAMQVVGDSRALLGQHIPPTIGGGKPAGICGSGLICRWASCSAAI